MPIIPLRILVLCDTTPHALAVANVLRESAYFEVFVATYEPGQALASLHQIGQVNITLCVFRNERTDTLELLQPIHRSGLAGSIVISRTRSSDECSVLGQQISLLGMALLGNVSEPSQAGVLQQTLAKHLNGPINQSVVPRVKTATEHEVRRALSGHQLHTYFQPKFNLQTGDVCGIEALARWHHPFKGVLPPSAFMPGIERCGLLDELFFLQLESGLRLQRQSLNHGFALNVGFNLHAGQLADPGLPGRIQTVFAAHDLPGSGVTFELTETGLLEVPAISLENLVRLRLMGCSLAIDDFGAGFSSLQRLCQLPFNEIKLDGEFVRGLGHEPRRRAVISSTLALGEALGMSVVVEGVETEEQRAALVELGCTQGQGYFCARPMTAANLLKWLDLRRGMLAIN